MGKFIIGVLAVLGLLFLMGTCEECSCSCDGSGASCNGCDIVSCDGCDGCDGCEDGCESCEGEDPRYNFDRHYGNITLKINRADGSTLELSGTRDIDASNSIFVYEDYEYRIRGFSYANEVGYDYRLEISMDDTTYTFYEERNGINTIFDKRLMFFHNDGAVVELTEKRSPIRYQVTYNFELNGVRDSLHCYYSIGDTIFIQDIQDVIGRIFSGSRYVFAGFVEEDTQKAFNTDGVVDANFIKQFDGNTAIRVKAVAEGQKVNVKLHYNLSGITDETKQVPFNVDLNSLFDFPIEKLEFFGWSISATEFIKWTGDIPEKYATETLELYAVHKFYKEIDVDGQTVKVYNDNTLSVQTPDGLMGLKESQTSTSYIKLSRLYDYVQEGKTYYWHIAG